MVVDADVVVEVIMLDLVLVTDTDVVLEFVLLIPDDTPPLRKYGSIDADRLPILILATVTLTTTDVEGVAVSVTILIDVGGVYVTKKVDF